MAPSPASASRPQPTEDAPGQARKEGIAVATYTVNTNARQDAGLAAYRAEINADRAAQTPPLGPLTLAQVADALFGRMLAARADRADEDERNTLKDAYQAATPATKAQVKSLLGVS